MQQSIKRFKKKAVIRLMRQKLKKLYKPKFPKGISGAILILVSIYVGLQFKDMIFNLPEEQMVMDAQTILTRVRSMGELTTSRYTFSTQVSTEIEMPEFIKVLYGQSQTLMVSGDVLAGVDISKTLAYPSTSLFDNRVTLVFPRAQIKDCIVNEGQTFVSADQRGIFATDRPNFDRKVRQFAVQQLLKAAMAMDIETTAQQNAETILRRLFFNTSLNVEIQFETISHVEVPASCQ